MPTSHISMINEGKQSGRIAGINCADFSFKADDMLPEGTVLTPEMRGRRVTFMTNANGGRASNVRLMPE